MNDDAFLEVSGVSKWFGSARHRHTAVDGLDLVVDRTSRTGVVGESGSGKSTLSRLLIGLEQPSAGTVSFNGRPLHQLVRSRTGRTEFRRAVQFVGQDTTSSFDPRRRLLDSLTRPLRDLHGARDHRLARAARGARPPPSLAGLRGSAAAVRAGPLPGRQTADPDLRRGGVRARRVGPGRDP
jgi:peptide/nickel transport system ATP-binding protein